MHVQCKTHSDIFFSMFSGAQCPEPKWLRAHLAWICAAYPWCSLRLQSFFLKMNTSCQNLIMWIYCCKCAFYVYLFSLWIANRPSDPYPVVLGPYCAQSYFGCCPDGHTAASGRLGEGCADEDCHRTRSNHPHNHIVDFIVALTH